MNSLTNLSKTWLIGFFEAEGSLTVATRGELQFVITQGYRNVAVLHYIKSLVGIGRVVKQGSTTFRFVVQDKEGLRDIIELLNGNLVLYKRREGEAGLKRFIEAYNKKYKANIEFNPSVFKPTRNDGWISGLSDGDGWFNIGYVKSKNTFPIRFILSQKDNLAEIQKVIGGSIELNKTNQCSSIVLKDLPSSTGKNTEWLLEYFRTFPLRTTKLNSFYIWQYVRAKILAGDLSPSEIENLKGTVKLINKIEPELTSEIKFTPEDGEGLN